MKYYRTIRRFSTYTYVLAAYTYIHTYKYECISLVLCRYNNNTNIYNMCTITVQYRGQSKPSGKVKKLRTHVFN